MAYSFICWRKLKKVFFLLTIVLALIWFLGLGGKVEANRHGRSSEPISIKAVVGGNFNLQFPRLYSKREDYSIHCLKEGKYVFIFKENNTDPEHNDFKGRMNLTNDSIKVNNFTKSDEGNYSCCSKVVTEKKEHECINQTVEVQDKEPDSKGLGHNDAVSPTVSPTTTPNTKWTIGCICGIISLVVVGLAVFVRGKRKRSADANQFELEVLPV